jgi:hypothetical protein
LRPHKSLIIYEMTTSELLSKKRAIIRDNCVGSFRHSSSLTSAAAVTISQRTDALVRGLDLILEHHGAPSHVRDELSKQIHHYLDSSCDETVWLKRSKFALTYPLSKYLRNVPPPLPDVMFEPSGLLRNWMKPRLLCFNRKNTHLWYSWLQAKRSTLPASDEIVSSTYDKHLATLTRRDLGDDETISRILSEPTFARLLLKLRKRISKLLDGSPPFEERFASNSACFERTRNQGGQHSELYIKSGSNNNYGLTELFSMRCDPLVYGRGIRYNVVSEVRIPIGKDDWETLSSHAEGIDLTKPIKCTIQAVLEPMKVRVISKGEALPYYTCRPLQKALHSSMRDLSCFRLIGRPFFPTDLIDLKKKALPSDQWFSIDYSAATDGLSWKYSGAIFKYLISGLPIRQQKLAVAVLGPHSLHYPIKGSREIEFKGIQQNGQLMGSILSFPILCLANLGVYLDVTRSSHVGWSDKSRLSHVLVNGDDMVYAADPSLWDKHIDVASKVGLEMSVGKAYIHREYVNINSTSVHYPLYKEGTPWLIKYLNSGLFFGQHKVQGRSDERRKESLESSLVDSEELSYLLGKAHINNDPCNGLVVNINTLLEGSLPGRDSPLLRKFLRMHSEDIRKECTMVIKYGRKTHLMTRNLFIPQALGGMGVNAPPSWKFRINKTDQLVATAIIERCGAPYCSGLPTPGYPIQDLETSKTVPWVMRQPLNDMYSMEIDKNIIVLSKTRLRGLSSIFFFSLLKRAVMAP